MECELCNKEFSSIQYLSIHISRKHKEITREEYYNKFLKKDNNDGFCKNCKKRTRFRGLDGYSNYCNTKCSNSHKEVMLKKEKSYIKHYGVNNPAKSLLIREKMENTCLKNHGVKIPAKSKDIIEKMKNTCFKNYGVLNVMKNKNVYLKFQNSIFKKYGVKHCQQSKIIRDRSIKTLLNKYGVSNIAKTKKEREKRRKICFEWLGAYACSFVKNPSKPQIELYNLTKKFYPSAILNCYLKEVNCCPDIVIPDLKIAIEYDGSYWHKDIEKDKIRQEKIENLGFKFIRYIDRLPNKEELIQDIHSLI